MCKYKLICFDLDDTLWPCMPTIEFAEQTLYEWLKQHKPNISNLYSIADLREKRKSLFVLRPELKNDLSLARREHFRQLADELNDATDWIETAFEVFYQARQKVSLFDDVKPVLQDLQSHYTLAALTNGNGHIDHTGLSNYFDFQISAADVNAAKPDPSMFIEAIRRAGVTPELTLHIGDHPIHDIRGARNAGIDAVWIRRFGQDWDDQEPRPLKAIDDLSELYQWLNN